MPALCLRSAETSGRRNGRMLDADAGYWDSPPSWVVNEYVALAIEAESPKRVRCGLAGLEADSAARRRRERPTLQIDAADL